MPRLRRRAEQMVGRQNIWSAFPKAPMPFRFTEYRKKEIKQPAIVRKLRPPCQIPYITPYKVWPVVKGDLVEILAGPDTGKQGKVRAVARAKNQIKVVGMNLEKELLPDKGFVLSEMPLHYTEVKLVNPITGRGTDVTVSYEEDGKKIRTCNHTNHVIPTPKYERDDYKDLSKAPVGKLDTETDVVKRHTYIPSLLLFHEEIMKEMNIPMTLPKTKLERRDLIMKEIEEDVTQENEEAKKIEQVQSQSGGVTKLLDKIKFWKLD